MCVVQTPCTPNAALQSRFFLVYPKIDCVFVGCVDAQIAPEWASEYGGKTIDINGTSYYHYEFKVNKKDPAPLAIEKLKGQVLVSAPCSPPFSFFRCRNNGLQC